MADVRYNCLIEKKEAVSYQGEVLQQEKKKNKQIEKNHSRKLDKLQKKLQVKQKSPGSRDITKSDPTHRGNVHRWSDALLKHLRSWIGMSDKIAADVLDCAKKKLVVETPIDLSNATKSLVGEFDAPVSASSVLNELQAHWSKELLLDLCLRLRLSKDRFNALRNMLFRKWDPIQCCYVPLVVAGVEVPVPFCWKTLSRLRKILSAEYGLTASPDGVTAFVDVNKKAAADLTGQLQNPECNYHVEEQDGKYYLLDKNTGFPPCMNVSLDAAYMMKMKQTALSHNYPNSGISPCSPDHTHETAVMESGDTYGAVKENFAKPLEQYQAIIDSGVLPSVTIPKAISPTKEEMILDVFVCVSVTLDQAACHEIFAQQGSNSCYPCPYCEIAKVDVLEFDRGKLKTTTRRTIERLELLAHVREGCCPGCGDDVVKNICDCGSCDICVRGRQVKLAKEGTDRPSTTWTKTVGEGPDQKEKKVGWLEKHFGVVFGRTPLFKVGLDQLVICILHMDLRIMGALVEKVLLGNVGKHCPGKSKEINCSELLENMKNIGLNIKKISCPVNKVETNWLSLNHYSMNGPDSAKFKEEKGWVDALEIVMPSEIRKEDPYLQMKFEAATRAFVMWSQILWPLINNRCLPQAEKAEQVEVKSAEFVELFQQAVGKTSHLYPHLLVAHLADQIRDLPCDIFFFQTQGLEHRHKQRKFVMAQNCNKHKPSLQRKRKVAAHNRQDGTVRHAYIQTTGISRQQQSLEYAVTQDHINATHKNHCRKVKIQELQEHNKKLKHDTAWQQQQRDIKSNQANISPQL